jgi:hypothetical protein
MPVSATLKKLFFGASALNYKGVKEPFKMKQEMVEDEKYFDKLFAGRYEERPREIRGG